MQGRACPPNLERQWEITGLATAGFKEAVGEFRARAPMLALTREQKRKGPNLHIGFSFNETENARLGSACLL